MEQAARLREQSMRKRLDEVMNLQPQQPQPTSFPQSVHPMHPQGPQTSNTPPLGTYGNVLPSLRNVNSPHGTFAIPPMKREADDDSVKDDIKKRAI